MSAVQGKVAQAASECPGRKILDWRCRRLVDPRVRLPLYSNGSSSSRGGASPFAPDQPCKAEAREDASKRGRCFKQGVSDLFYERLTLRVDHLVRRIGSGCAVHRSPANVREALLIGLRHLLCSRCIFSNVDAQAHDQCQATGDPPDLLLASLADKKPSQRSQKTNHQHRHDTFHMRPPHSFACCHSLRLDSIRLSRGRLNNRPTKIKFHDNGVAPMCKVSTTKRLCSSRTLSFLGLARHAVAFGHVTGHGQIVISSNHHLQNLVSNYHHDSNQGRLR